MARIDGTVSDAMVDTYRDLMQLKRDLAATGCDATRTGPTPGAGRNCVHGRTVPGKRLRNWHRANRRGMSLRAFARAIASRRLDGFAGDLAVATAQRWLDSKGARP